MTPDVPAPPIPRHQCRDGYIRRYDRDFPPVDAFPRRPARVEPSPRTSLVEVGARSGRLLSILLFLRSSSFDGSSIGLSAFMLESGRRYIPSGSVPRHGARKGLAAQKFIAQTDFGGYLASNLSRSYQVHRNSIGNKPPSIAR